jgi:hypothetical protein
MRFQATRLWLQRRELGLGVALVATTLVLVGLSGPLLVWAVLRPSRTKQRRELAPLSILFGTARAVRWLWLELHGLPHRSWHPCAQCRRPIEVPSRAWYCSPNCRRWARWERDARGGDELAHARIARASRLADMDALMGEVPF